MLALNFVNSMDVCVCSFVAAQVFVRRCLNTTLSWAGHGSEGITIEHGTMFSMVSNVCKRGKNDSCDLAIPGLRHESQSVRYEQIQKGQTLYCWIQYLGYSFIPRLCLHTGTYIPAQRHSESTHLTYFVPFTATVILYRNSAVGL